MSSIARLVPKRIPNVWPVPTFLCPFLHSYNARSLIPRRSPPAQKVQCRSVHVATTGGDQDYTAAAGARIDLLPWSCPGCGAYTQSQEKDDAGFYSATRKPVRAFLSHQKKVPTRPQGPADVVEEASDVEPLDGTAARDPPAVPVCDRCHNLQHHHQGVSIAHPTLQSIQDMVSDSPYKHNHVYHVLDAADFPMSLVPKLQRILSLTPLRSRNRRSTPDRHHHGAISDMSFIITRSDLLAPRKEQVDTMMPDLTEVLRDALGSAGEGVRLGNVRCVSPHRGWWTKEVKEDVWKRGGGGWMVGKVNVGKSSLLENIFPKGRAQDAATLGRHVLLKQNGREAIPKSVLRPLESTDETTDLDADPSGLLPPMPLEAEYPILPVVSHLPGTTASPIRLPFGRGKGELIDLPGLARGNLENLVLDDHKSDLVMQHRIKAPQISIKPWQSLVISNLIRITPVTPDLVFLACPFVPVDYHLTNTEKAQAILNQENSTSVTGIAKPGVNETIKSAGKFELKWNVTRARAGPLTRPDAAGLNADRLHFIVYSTDILIEGVGWIELAAQVRKSAIEGKDGEEPSFQGFPTVEVFSPNGEHVGARKPINAWMIGGKQRKPVGQRTTRPRRSMKGVKKNMKKLAREAATA